MVSNFCTSQTTTPDDDQYHIEMDAPISSTKAPFTTLPAEILQRILHFASTPTFLQLIHVNRNLFNVAGESREVILHHLRHLPGLKLGLSDHRITTTDLFLILRQRAASNLYGTNFTADCMSFAFSNHAQLNPHASSLSIGTDGYTELSMVVTNDSSIRLYSQFGSYRETIESPYADGEAKIIQVVQNEATISVLYAWTPPERDLTTRVENHEPTIKGSTKHILTMSDNSSRHGLRSAVRINQTPPSNRVRSIRYHLLHYNIYTNDRPVFFHIPTHRSLRNTILAPVHLAVYSRVLCAIVWDEPDVMRPTARTSVILYTAGQLPRREEGIYSAFVVYPFDHPAPVFSTGVKSVLAKDKDNGIDDDDGCGEQLWTTTNPKESKHDCDLRLMYARVKPRATSFFKDGRRLALYAPGSSVPYMTLLANEVLRQQLEPSLGERLAPSLETGLTSRLGMTERRDIRLQQLRRKASGTNATTVNGLGFQLSLPFFSRHDSMFMRDGDDLCMTHDLCIGTSKVPDLMIYSPKTARFTVDMPGPPVLTIVQIRRCKPYDVCMHVETKDDLPHLPPPPRPPPPRTAVADIEPSPPQIQAAHIGDDDFGHVANTVSYADDEDQDYAIQEEILAVQEEMPAFPRNIAGTDLRVVARLWGWAPQSTTLTGLDTVSVSPNGQRIAVAQWDRVLVYALDPAALCEPPFEQDLELGGSSDGTASPAPTDWGTVSDSGSDDGDDSDVESLAGLGVGVVHLPEALPETNNMPSSTTNDDEAEHDVSINNDSTSNTNTADGIENGHSLHSNHPPPDSDSDGPPPEQPLSPAVPEPPSSVFPTPHPPAAGVSKGAASSSQASSSSSSSSSSRLLKFYPRTHGGFLGRKVVELRPIVLKMEGGAVVRKMVWGLDRGPDDDDDNDNDNDNDNDVDGDDKDDDDNGDDEDRDSEAVEHDGKNREEILLDSDKLTGDENEVGRADDGTDGEGMPREPIPHLQSTSDSMEFTHSREPQKTQLTNAQYASPGSSKAPGKGIDSTATSTKDTHQAEAQSSGLTPQSRLQIADSELMHQIKFVKRPPEYTVALGGSGDIIDLGHFDTKVAESASASSQDNNGGKKPRIIIIGSPSGSAEDELDEDKPSERPSRPSSPSHASSTQHPPSVVSSVTERPRPKPKRRKKIMENEIVIMTDRDVQLWDLGVWGKGRRVQSEFARPSS